jgi:hypothetical protein
MSMLSLLYSKAQKGSDPFCALPYNSVCTSKKSCAALYAEQLSCLPSIIPLIDAGLLQTAQ